MFATWMDVGAKPTSTVVAGKKRSTLHAPDPLAPDPPAPARQLAPEETPDPLAPAVLPVLPVLADAPLSEVAVVSGP
jgi:hypothetical protein